MCPRLLDSFSNVYFRVDSGRLSNPASLSRLLRSPFLQAHLGLLALELRFSIQNYCFYLEFDFDQISLFSILYLEFPFLIAPIQLMQSTLSSFLKVYLTFHPSLVDCL